MKEQLKPGTDVQDKPQELSEEQLSEAAGAGAINPQPLPPRRPGNGPTMD